MALKAFEGGHDDALDALPDAVVAGGQRLGALAAGGRPGGAAQPGRDLRGQGQRQGKGHGKHAQDLLRQASF